MGVTVWCRRPKIAKDLDVVLLECTIIWSFVREAAQ